MKNYKITPDIRDFVLQKAREQPRLGSRKLSLLIQESFQLNISKSSIAAILKSEGLNKAIGRPRMRPVMPQSIGEITNSQGRASFNEARPCNQILGLKFILEDQTVFFLDAGFQSIWPTSRIPSGFSLGMDRLRQELERTIILNQQPLILLAAPGFQAPAPVFLSFAASLQGDDAPKAIKCIELYAKDGVMVERLEAPGGHCEESAEGGRRSNPAKHHFLIGLWPWQYKIIRDRHQLFQINGVCPYFFSLRRVAKQKDGQEILTVLTNMDETLANDDKILQLYFNRWPEPEKSYQEFLSKITASLSSLRGAFTVKGKMDFGKLRQKMEKDIARKTVQEMR